MSFFQDLHFGWRNLSRTPGFFFIAVVSLALGIGANTALFSLIYSAIYKALPVEAPQQLVLFNDPAANGMSMGSDSGERRLMTWNEFEDLHAMKSMEGMLAAEAMLPRLTVRIGSSEEEARGKLVSGAYFSVLGLHPEAGRFFDESVDRQQAGAPYVVLSDEYWTRRFGRDPGVVGKSIIIQKTAFDVIGVGPHGFSGEDVGQNPDFWVPLSMQMQVQPGMDFLHAQPDPTLKVMWLHVFGRLAPGANLAQAQTQASAIFKESLEQSYQALSADSKKGLMDQYLRLRPAANGASGMRDRFAGSMYVIFAAVGAILLICCANLSNLLLARAHARQREITVRLALGANKFRVARQMVTEGLLLSFIGAGVGLLLSQAITPLLLRMASSGDSVIHLDVGIDWRVLLFTGGVAVATTLICSLIPALRAARTQLMTTLREGGRGLAGSRGKLAAGRMFVGAQVALSMILLVGAGLFLRTLVNLQQVDLGYKKDRLALIAVDASPAGYKSEARGVLFRRLLEKFQTTPGVVSATMSGNGLFSGSEMADSVTVEGYTATGKDDKGSRIELVGPGYFSSLGIPLMQGREITQRDAPGSTAVCVINKAFARVFFAGRNPIGKHVTNQFGDDKTVFEVVGVASDSRDHSLRDKVLPREFVSLLQGKFGNEVSRRATYEVRLGMDSGSALPQLKNVVLGVDRGLEVNTQFLSKSIGDEVSQERLLANLVTLFGGLALLLAAIGIYGILAYGVSQRTSEIGVRIAIGAGTGDVVKLIVRDMVWMVSGGLAVGILASYFLTRLVESKLFGVTATDPVVGFSALAILGMIALLAAAVPALRAARIDPAIALRDE